MSMVYGKLYRFENGHPNDKFYEEVGLCAKTMLIDFRDSKSVT